MRVCVCLPEAFRHRDSHSHWLTPLWLEVGRRGGQGGREGGDGRGGEREGGDGRRGEREGGDGRGGGRGVVGRKQKVFVKEGSTNRFAIDTS